MITESSRTAGNTVLNKKQHLWLSFIRSHNVNMENTSLFYGKYLLCVKHFISEVTAYLKTHFILLNQAISISKDGYAHTSCILCFLFQLHIWIFLSEKSGIRSTRRMILPVYIGIRNLLNIYPVELSSLWHLHFLLKKIAIWHWFFSLPHAIAFTGFRN